MTIAIIVLLAVLSLGLYLTTPPFPRLPEPDNITEEKDPFLRSLARVLHCIDDMTHQEGQFYLDAAQRFVEREPDEALIVTAGPITLWAFPLRKGYIMTSGRLLADRGDVSVFAYTGGHAGTYRRSISFVPRSPQDALDLWEAIREEEEEDKRSEPS